MARFAPVFSLRFLLKSPNIANVQSAEGGANAARERTTMKTTAQPAALFWSATGEVACATHAPYRGSDTWRTERWTAMTERDEIRMRGALVDANARRASTRNLCSTCDGIEQRRAEVTP